MRRRVAKGRVARDRRYEHAVRRQIDLVAAAKYDGGWAYADAEEFLRRGDSLERFRCEPYFCPSSGQLECCPLHGGFDVCCTRPDLHELVTETSSPSGADGA